MKVIGNFEVVCDVDLMVVLSDKICVYIDYWLFKFLLDCKCFVVLQGLYVVQEQNQGWLIDELIVGVVKYLDLLLVWVYEVVSFYLMFEIEKVGCNNVVICINISCWFNGVEDIVCYCEKKLGIKYGELIFDGCVYFKCEEECLVGCGGVLMMVINGYYYECLILEKVDELLDGLE